MKEVDKMNKEHKKFFKELMKLCDKYDVQIDPNGDDSINFCIVNEDYSVSSVACDVVVLYTQTQIEADEND